MADPLDIAIVGMAGVYAGSADVRAYWQNILDKRYLVSEAAPEWSREVLDAERGGGQRAGNRIYTAQGGWLHDLAEFDPREFGVMPNTVDGREPDHFLALRIARDALADSGYLHKPFNHERAGIILGRGNNTNRGAANLIAHGSQIDQMVDIVATVRPDFSDDELEALREGLRAQLPPFNPEMLPGLIPNVTTGVIANRLDLMGPNCIVDAACASSLVALEQACRELQLGRCDLMLSGGVHAQTPPHSYMIFSQINALSRERVRPFDAAGSGTLLGEGCGVVVLKRLTDAEAAGDRVYAVIKGIGVASDGKAKGLFAPRKEGQVVAIRRAYEAAGIAPQTVSLIEAHATGIPLGDRTEIESLTEIFGPRRGPLPTIALGSVKSQISHAIPASGAASLIKMALALDQKVLPPMLLDTPAPHLGLEKTPFYLNNQTRPWVHDPRAPRRAAADAFGFGGINAHVLLEEYRPRERPVQVPVLHAPSASELVMLGATSLAALRESLAGLQQRLRETPLPALAAIAAHSARAAQGPYRLAVVAADLEDLAKKMAQAAEKLAAPEPRPFKTRSGLYFGVAEQPPGKLCFLFPGEGAQYPDLLADVAVNFPAARAWFGFLESTLIPGQRDSRAPVFFPPPTLIDEAQRRQLEDQLYDMDVASEAVFCASMALFDVLSGLGLKADAMLGHSTGENTALTASRVRRFDTHREIADTVRDLNRIFRELEARGEIAEGALLTLGALKPEQRAALLARDDGIVVAMDNCPNQLVVFGPRVRIDALKTEFSAEGVICAELPFGRAYHTALFKPIADAYRDYFKTIDFGPGIATLYSARSAAPFPAEAEAIRELVAQQWEHRVRFTETVERLYADGVRVFLEVGPSSNLTSFVTDILRDRPDALVLASNSRRKSGIGQLQNSLAQLFVNGLAWDPAALFAHRDVPALTPADPGAAARPRLNLQMPRLAWPERLPVPPLPIAADASAPAALPPAPASPTPSIAAANAPSDDPRLAALQTHFALMQSFLDSQARVLGLAGAPTATAAPAALSPLPADAVSRLPLLRGQRGEGDAQRRVIHQTLTLGEDCFLQDHTIGGRPSALDASLLPIPVVPFTFSMELLAEAAQALVDDPALKVIGIDQARGSRWLSLDEGELSLRIEAQRQPPDAGETVRVQARIFALGKGYPDRGLLVFEGLVRLAPAYQRPPAPAPWTSADEHPARNNPDGELYHHGMFHGPRLQGVKHLRRWGAESIDADLEALPTQDYFRFTRQPQFQLDAALLDAAGQLAGYWLTEKHSWGFNCFPFRLKRFETYAPPPAAGTRTLCRMRLRLTGEQLLEAHMDIVGPDGQLLMRAESWEDRKFAVPQRLYDYRLQPQTRFMSEAWQREGIGAAVWLRRMAPFDAHFLDEGGAIWKRMLAHMVLGHRERALFYALPASGPRREEWLMGRIAAKEALREWAWANHRLSLASADIELLPDARGRPQAACPQRPELRLPPVSISHSRRWAVAALGEPGQVLGLDYQRSEGVSTDLLAAGALTDRERALLKSRPPAAQAQATLALWCAKEAAAKSDGLGFGGRPVDWRVAVLDPAAAPTHAEIHHDSGRHLVSLHYPDPQEVLALCRARLPLNDTATAP
jgi:acyl transferase domain-containing protein/phosphopantetheinyl transferase